MQFTIGADPEFFLKQNGQHKSAVGLIGGSKDFPRPLEREGFAILEDNVSVEFNIAPCHNHEEFISAIGYVMANLKQELPNYEFSEDSAVIFDQDQLNHPQAMEFGCMPDFDAWSKSINPRPKAENMQLRSAGGHVHVAPAGTYTSVAPNNAPYYEISGLGVSTQYSFASSITNSSASFPSGLYVTVTSAMLVHH